MQTPFMFVSMCWKEKPSYEKKLHQANLIVHAQLGHTLQIPYDAYFIKKGRKSIKTWVPMNDIITYFQENYL